MKLAGSEQRKEAETAECKTAMAARKTPPAVVKKMMLGLCAYSIGDEMMLRSPRLLELLSVRSPALVVQRDLLACSEQADLV